MTAHLTLKVQDQHSRILSASSEQDFVQLVHADEYREGDMILLESSEENVWVWIQVDDALGASLCLLRAASLTYTIPFGEKRLSYSPKAFSGNRHYLRARIAREDEVYAYRNLALNVCDQHGDTRCYPHAFANVETRGESVFAARNAIDGVCENRSHGEWPYQSWGINRRADAEMTVDFGTEVEVDKVVLYTRADFPHDSWWTQVTLTFSDGTSVDWPMEKSVLPHSLPLAGKRTTSVNLSRLIKADDPSPFPALTQIEVYGRVVS